MGLRKQRRILEVVICTVAFNKNTPNIYLNYDIFPQETFTPSEINKPST